MKLTKLTHKNNVGLLNGCDFKFVQFSSNIIVYDFIKKKQGTLQKSCKNA